MKLLKTLFRRARRMVIRLWRVNAAIPRLLRYNPYTGFFGRKLFFYLPFVLPHDKSYYGFAHLVHEGDGLFLDVGANDGISAVGFRHVHSDYRILSVEPNLCHERHLRKLKRRLKRFDYLLLGAGRSRSQMTLHIPIFNGVPIYTAASLRKEYAMETMQQRHCPGQRDKNIVIVEFKVDVIPLDDLQLQPDIIKIDTEGFDYEVLLGLQQTIDRHRPSVLIEYSSGLMADLETFFKKRAYRLFVYDPAADIFHVFDGDRAREAASQPECGLNIFCVPSEKANALPLQKTD